MRSVDAVPPPPRSPDTPLLITDDAQSVAVRSSAGTSINAKHGYSSVRSSWLGLTIRGAQWTADARDPVFRTS
jgi:hypothetical protein